MIPLLTGLPGVGTARESVYRRIFNTRSFDYLPGGKIISGTYSRDQGNTPVTTLRAGTMMGKRTSDGYYAPSLMGATDAAYAAGATSLTVTSAAATELARRVGATGTFKIVGPPTAAGSVTTETVTYSAIVGTTVTVTALVNSYISGSLVMPTDGSEAPKTFIPDGYGFPLLDETNTAVNQPFPLMPIYATVEASKVIGWPSDTSLQDWIIGAYSVQGEGHFTWDTRY